MPDSFFSASKHRKRKLEDSNSNAGPSGAKKSRPGNVARKKIAIKVNGVSKGRKTKAMDEELSAESDAGPGGIDDMDLRGDVAEDVAGSGEEDEDETPAEKRLRLAKLYLESVKEGLGTLHSVLCHILPDDEIIAEGEFDAAEIDKELISARLRQDVLEHSGKVHLFIADSVCRTYLWPRFPVNSFTTLSSTTHNPMLPCYGRRDTVFP